MRSNATRPPAELVPRVQQRGRLIQGLLRDGASQGRLFSKRSFRTYMLANLEANNVGAMPVLYRLA